MRKSGLSARGHDERQVRSAIRPSTRPSAVKATLGRNKLWVTTGAANHPALTKSKRPTPVFPVPADSLKACAYTHMGRGLQGADAGFCWRGWNRAAIAANPPSVQPERSRRPRSDRPAWRALRLRSVRPEGAIGTPSPFPLAYGGRPPSLSQREREGGASAPEG